MKRLRVILFFFSLLFTLSAQKYYYFKGNKVSFPISDSVVPNPATNNIAISYVESLASATIYTISGQLFLQTVGYELDGATNPEINVSSLPAGVYVVRAQTSSGQQLQAKFVKL